MSGPLVLSIESSCDETGIALVEGGRRIRANVVASQVALHAATGGIVPEVAARAHLRWVLPVLDEAWNDGGIAWEDLDAVAVTYGPGLAGSLLVGINVAKTLAWVHDKPLIGVNHLEGHVYAAWLLDPGEDERPEPLFPLVALVVSGGHTFLVEMTDHLTYRLLGQTVDDAAGEAFDKVGRLLGLGYPGGPAIMAAAAGATQRDAVFPRAWLGDSYDFSFSGLKTAARRVIDAARSDAGLRDPDEPLPSAIVAELAHGFQESVVDVLATKTIRAADIDGCPLDRVGRRRGRERDPARPDRCRGGTAPDPAARAPAGALHRQRRDDRRRRRPTVRGGGPCPVGPRCPALAPPSAPRLIAAMPRPATIDASTVQRALRAAGLRARSSLSQNFLADADILAAILEEAAPAPGIPIIEIGPGLGILTRALVDSGAPVTAIELDHGLASYLRVEFAAALASGSFQLIEGDALDEDLAALVPPPYDVVANIPYHITSPILHALLGAPPRPRRIVLMVQREVAERIAAPPGSMSYLSVFVQYHARARIAFTVPREAFEPMPKVASAVLVLEPFAEDDRLEDPAAEDALWRLVQAGFRERRKMLHNVLTRQLPVSGERVDGALRTTGIDPDRRPQTLAVGEWIALLEAIGPIGEDLRGRRAR